MASSAPHMPMPMATGVDIGSASPHMLLGHGVRNMASTQNDSSHMPTVPTPSPQVASLLQKGACVSCHGANFSKPIDGNTPKIAGQYADYLYASLKAYRDDTHRTWGRGNPVMAGQAKQFSDQELKALSKYLSTVPGDLATVPEPHFIR